MPRCKPSRCSEWNDFNGAHDEYPAVLSCISLNRGQIGDSYQRRRAWRKKDAVSGGFRLQACEASPFDSLPNGCCRLVWNVVRPELSWPNSPPLATGLGYQRGVSQSSGGFEHRHFELQPGSRSHVHRRIKREQVDLAAHQVRDTRLSGAEELGRLRLPETSTSHGARHPAILKSAVLLQRYEANQMVYRSVGLDDFRQPLAVKGLVVRVLNTDKSGNEGP